MALPLPPPVGEPSAVDIEITAEQMRLEWLRSAFGSWTADEHPPWSELSATRRAKWLRAARAAWRMFKALGLAKDSGR